MVKEVQEVKDQQEVKELKEPLVVLREKLVLKVPKEPKVLLVRIGDLRKTSSL